MKNILTFIFGTLWLSTIAQKHDYILLIPNTNSEATKLDFNEDSLKLTVVNISMPLIGAKSFLSDENGSLLAYTNGIWIANKTGAMMENGDSINAGYYASGYAEVGYPIYNDCFFLPRPGNSTQYYLFHMFKELSGIPIISHLYSLRYSIIDFSFNNGLGKVIEKNISLLEGDTVNANYRHATAVKHANGRDWWILVPNDLGPEYFRMLVTPDGILGPWSQEIGFKAFPSWHEPSSRGLFSPEGAKFADYGLAEFIEIFNFDRCSGLLSNPLMIDIEWMPGINNGKGAVAFSESGRFLYVTRTVEDTAITTELAQYDLEAVDVLASKVVLASCIGNASNACYYGNMLLCSDRKIYIPGNNGINAFHVIHNPNLQGVECDFEKDGLVFPIENPNGNLPYIPNYRLYDIPESPCDSLGINAPVATEEPKEDKNIHIYPNPASDELHLSFSQPQMQPFTLTLHDLAGRMVQQWQVPSSTTEITFSLAGLSKGLFFWRLSLPGRTTATGKLIILK